jgi:hypothetical protein
MATNLKNRSKKLYFDVLLADASTNASFPCTQIVASTPGDRYGCLLEAAIALTGSAASGKKRANAVSAWFEPSAFALENATTPVDFLFSTRFVQPTSRGINQTGLQALPYLTVGGASVPNNAGHEAIYGTAGSVRHFSVQVRKLTLAGGALSVHGVLYVQRQHSIEV